jgi:hypothetical protein
MSFITYADEDQNHIVHGNFRNRRIHEPLLSNVYPAGFSLQRDIPPPKYRHFHESYNENGVREYIPVVAKPQTTMSRSRSPISPLRTMKQNISQVDEFRNVAGRFFKVQDIDDSIQLPGPASAVTLEPEKCLSQSSHGSLPSLPQGRVLSMKHVGNKHYTIQHRYPPPGIKIDEQSSLLSGGESTFIREIMTAQNKALAIDIELIQADELFKMHEPVSWIVAFESSHIDILNYISELVRKDIKSHQKRGRFTLNLKFFKEIDSSWYPMNTELQWIQAKSSALDHKQNHLKVMYEVIDQHVDTVSISIAEITPLGSVINDYRQKIDVNLNPTGIPPKYDVSAPTSIQSRLSMELSCVLTPEHHIRGFTDSQTSNKSLDIVKRKQNAMATNLESRLRKRTGR